MCVCVCVCVCVYVEYMSTLPSAPRDESGCSAPPRSRQNHLPHLHTQGGHGSFQYISIYVCIHIFRGLTRA